MFPAFHTDVAKVSKGRRAFLVFTVLRKVQWEAAGV